LPIREAELEQPIIVQRQYPVSVYKQDKAEGEAYARLSRDRGYVEVEFIVGTYGRPLQVEVTDSEPPGLLDVHVARRVKEFRYRPMMRDGEPVNSDVQTFRHEFRYREDRLSKEDRRRIENLRERRRASAEKRQLEAEAVAEENADGQP
jgi:TonB family protein